MSPESDQLALEVGAGTVPAPAAIHGPFQPPCGDLGPYVWERYTSTNRRQFVAIKCNRPRHLSGNHQWMDRETGATFVWTADGRPVHPLPIKSEVQNHGNT